MGFKGPMLTEPPIFVSKTLYVRNQFVSNNWYHLGHPVVQPQGHRYRFKSRGANTANLVILTNTSVIQGKSLKLMDAIL